MATSPLYPGSDSRPNDRRVNQGHGTRELGPSDSSDTGSDLVGAPGFADDVGDDDFPLDAPGTTSDPERTHAGGTAGPDVGDANLDSDSDRYGTGETAAASRDVVAEAQDIDADHIERIPDDEEDKG